MNNPLKRAVLLSSLAFLVACGDAKSADSNNNSGAAAGPPPASVSVAAVERRMVTDWDQFNGRIEAVHRVELRPRVSGYLQEVHFREGSVVNKGDVLFTIDQREYQNAVKRSEANLLSARTTLELAELEQARSKNLIEVRAISAEEYEQRQSEVVQARAQIASLDADLSQTRLNLEFATIRAPLTGRIGEALIMPGNLVTPGETLLTTLVSIDPVHVVFEGDENIYLKYQKQAQNGVRPSSRDFNNPVRVGLVNEEGYPHEGEMDFVDNALDPATGTIRGRAVLANPDGLFTPGLFARIRLLGSSEYEALLISGMAVLTDQDRKYVYIMDSNGRAERRDVVLGREIDGLRVVSSGLSEGDKVVVNGVRKIFFPGMPLNPSSVTMDNPMAKTNTSGGSDQAAKP